LEPCSTACGKRAEFFNILPEASKLSTAGQSVSGKKKTNINLLTESGEIRAPNAKRVTEYYVVCLCYNMTDPHPFALYISLHVFNFLFCWARCIVAKFPSCKKGHRNIQRKYIACDIQFKLAIHRRVEKCGITVTVLGKIN